MAHFRRVNAFTGEKAPVTDPPSRFMQALSEADNFVQDLDRVHELQTRVEELTAERDSWRERALAPCWRCEE